MTIEIEDRSNPVTFDGDIKPLFRPFDIPAMKRARGFDLSNYADVSSRADDILDQLSSGAMPCDSAWPADQVQKFRDWINGGKQP